MSAVAMQLDKPPAASAAHQALRKACDEFAGMAFFGQLLREARDSYMKSELMDSSAQRLWTSQLDDVLIQRGGGRLAGSLGDVLYRQLSKALPAEPDAGGRMDMKA